MKRSKLGGRGLGDQYKNDLKEHLLINLHEFLIPFINIGSLSPGISVIVAGARRIALVVFAPLDHFLEDRLIHLR